MKTYYKNNLNQAFLVIEGEEEVEADFQVFMLQENDIPGLLRTGIRYVDNMSCYHYDISGKISLKSKHDKAKLSHENIKHLIHALLSTMKEIQKYMLDGTGILLDPEYIYCEGDHYFFCYYPPCRQELKDEFHKLTEFFVREVDYEDKKGVHLAYTFHKATMEENYSIEKILDEVSKEEAVPAIHYDERLEEAALEQVQESSAVAEDKGLWEPVRRFLERRKREKWGQWDE